MRRILLSLAAGLLVLGGPGFSAAAARAEDQGRERWHHGAHERHREHVWEHGREHGEWHHHRYYAYPSFAYPVYPYPPYYLMPYTAPIWPR